MHHDTTTVYWIYLLDNGLLGRMEGVYEARDADAAIEQHLLYLGCDPAAEEWGELVAGLVAVRGGGPVIRIYRDTTDPNNVGWAWEDCNRCESGELVGHELEATLSTDEALSLCRQAQRETGAGEIEVWWHERHQLTYRSDSDWWSRP